MFCVALLSVFMECLLSPCSLAPRARSYTAQLSKCSLTKCNYQNTDLLPLDSFISPEVASSLKNSPYLSACRCYDWPLVILVVGKPFRQGATNRGPTYSIEGYL